MSINWTSIWEKALEIGPGILADVFADKATMSNESKLAAATQATLQSEDIAKELLPADTNEIAAVGAGVGAILSGLQTTPPVVSEATVEPVTVAKITPQVTLPVASAKAASGTGGAVSPQYRIQPEAETVSVGETAQFTVRDLTNHPPPPTAKIVWSITGNTKGATINQTGAYNSGTAAGTDTVTATIDGVPAQPATVTVTL